MAATTSRAIVGEVELEAIANAEAARSRVGIDVICTPAGARKTLEKYDNFLIDCDGVLWHAGELLPRAKDTVNMLQKAGKNVVFVTNNSGRSRRGYAEKMSKFGFEVKPTNIVPSSFAAADYLTSAHPEVRKVYCVGAAGLREELEKAGMEVIGAVDETEPKMDEEEFKAMELDPEVGAVVCGWDLSFSFRKLCIASMYLQRNKGCVFVATNRDPADKLPNGLMPGNGCAVAAIEHSLGLTGFTAGKPSKWLADRVTDLFSLDPSRTLMIGDRLDTDILFGNTGGFDAALVMTGTTDVKTLTATPEDSLLRPDVILPYFGALHDLAGGKAPAAPRSKL